MTHGWEPACIVLLAWLQSNQGSKEHLGVEDQGGGMEKGIKVQGNRENKGRNRGDQMDDSQ